MSRGAVPLGIFLSINQTEKGDVDMNDTIVGISTAVGEAAIHMIRLSGDKAVEIAEMVFRGKQKVEKMASHTIAYGKIYDLNSEVIDEVLLSVFLPPRTYTKEPIVEISCHGGIRVMFEIYELLQQCGARKAEAGEFTKRAFLNGRIDLTQAEAVMGIIEAENRQALKLANANLAGRLSSEILKLQEQILSIIATIEVNIDYPEYDDVEEMTQTKILEPLLQFQNQLQALIAKAQSGKKVSEGIRVALVGRPNVGKSSILNMLLEENKAIVTDVAGTTRDVVEGQIRLGAFKLQLVDTAGIRETDDIVEKIGVERSKKAIEDAELVLFVLSQPDGLTEEDQLLQTMMEGKNVIYLLNKSDIHQGLEQTIEDGILFSTYENIGKSELIQKLNGLYPEFLETAGRNQILANERQITLLKKSELTIQETIQQTLMGEVLDLLIVSLTESWTYLGEVTGSVSKDTLLDELFSKFCLGK